MLIQMYEGKSITEWALEAKVLREKLAACERERDTKMTDWADRVRVLAETVTERDKLRAQVTQLEQRVAERDAELQRLSMIPGDPGGSIRAELSKEVEHLQADNARLREALKGMVDMINQPWPVRVWEEPIRAAQQALDGTPYR